MKRFLLRALVTAAFIAMQACTQGTNALPAATILNPVASNKLQFSVGIATIASGGAVGKGLNVVETLRQPNSLSGTLFNVPTITGPVNFAIAQQSIGSSISPPIATLARGDIQTNRITTQTFDTQQATDYVQNLPFASTGAFGYGLCACNANAAAQTGAPQLFHAYNLPFYAVLPFGDFSGGNFVPNLRYYGAPPAFPGAPAGTAAAGFVGYPTGFADFAVAPVAGSYRLDVALPPDFTTSVNASTPTLTSAATLTSTQGLPAFATPQFASDHAGGGTILISVPQGVTETMLFIQEGQSAPYCSDNRTQPTYYTLFVASGGQQGVTLPDKLGPADAAGAPTATLCGGAPYFIYAAGFDYPAYEASYPQSASQTPAISGPNGQSDVTTSDAFAGVYE